MATLWREARSGGSGLDPRHSCCAGGIGQDRAGYHVGGRKGAERRQGESSPEWNGCLQRGSACFYGPLGGAFLKPRPLGVDSYLTVLASTPVNASDVNCTPWSLLKISG